MKRIEFEDSNGNRFVKLFTEAQCQAYLAQNPDIIVISEEDANS